MNANERAAQTVYVGLSGGVDSSVAAALLKQRGYRVVGVYLQNWTEAVAGVQCPWQTDLADAKAVAARLDIPFKVLNFEAEYKARVVDYLVAEYQAGRTPNPDVMCNQEIKFKLFLETALAEGADLIATGHYARVKHGQLYAGVDTAKDQSYFLYRLSTQAVARSLLPIGDYHKAEVRALAAQLGLPTAAKPDSQGICFVGPVGLKDFLRPFVTAKPGPVILIRDGRQVGRHDGAVFYTIGQRHGLGIGGGQPYYVVSKDMGANTVYVTDEPADQLLASDRFDVADLHWIKDEPQLSKTYRVRSRYRANLIACRLQKTDTGYRVHMLGPERAISPGQSAVIYDGGRVLGGGIISADPAIAPSIHDNYKKQPAH
ncbi:MAG TPA: tRNA 2-thiouridine(34) synthase MnmA [Candidatus Saccharimonadales bacterium]|nr:tRNA 2-thiouridine(34) synthase MnmA [Candidatus Saccharimonadales bacterium]